MTMHMISPDWGGRVYPVSLPSYNNIVSNIEEKYYKRSSRQTVEEDITEELQEIKRLLESVLEKQSVMASQDKTAMCGMCSQTVGHLAAMDYVRTQQQIYTGREEQSQSQDTSQPFHSQENSDQAMRDIMKVQVQGRRRKRVKSEELIKMKKKLADNKRNYNGFHNKFHAHLRAMPASNVVQNNNLLARPVSSLAVLSKVTQAESDTKGLRLVRRKRKRNRSKGRGRGFISLFGPGAQLY